MKQKIVFTGMLIIAFGCLMVPHATAAAKATNDTTGAVPVQQGIVSTQPEAYNFGVYIPWDPFIDMQSLQQQMNTMLPNNSRRWHKGTTPVTDMSLNAAVDIKEIPDAYVFHFDFPGVKKEDIAVTINDNILTVHAVRNQDTERTEQGKGVTYYRQERGFGTFEQRYTLPNDAMSDATTAQYVNGVLTVTVPKAKKTEESEKGITVPIS